MPPDEDKVPGLSNNWAQNTLSGGLTVSGKNPFRKWIPLTPISSLQTPSFILLPYSLASNRLSPYMILTSIPPVSSLGVEVSPILDSDPVVGSPPFNISHLTLHLISPWCRNLPYIAIPEHLIKTFPLTSILTSIPSWSNLTIFCEVLPVFSCKTVLNT